MQRMDTQNLPALRNRNNYPMVRGPGIFSPIPAPGECFVGVKSRLYAQLTWLKRITPTKIQSIRDCIVSKKISCTDQNQQHGCELISVKERGYRFGMRCPSTCTQGHEFTRDFATDATAHDLLDAVEESDWERAREILQFNAKYEERAKSHLCPPVKDFYCRVRKHMKDESMPRNISRKMCHNGKAICSHGSPCLYNGGVNDDGLMNVPYWVNGVHVSWVPVLMDWKAVDNANRELATGLPSYYRAAAVDRDALTPADPLRTSLIFKPSIECWPFNAVQWNVFCLLPHSYPTTAPILSFVEKIPFHPAICPISGLVSPALINANWRTSSSMTDILMALPNILQNPDKTMNLNSSAAHVLDFGVAQFRQTASAKIRKSLPAPEQRRNLLDIKDDIGEKFPAPNSLFPSSRTLSAPRPLLETSTDQVATAEGLHTLFDSSPPGRTRRRSFSTKQPGFTANMRAVQSLARFGGDRDSDSDGSNTHRASKIIDLTMDSDDVKAESPHIPNLPHQTRPDSTLRKPARAKRADSFINDSSDLGYGSDNELDLELEEGSSDDVIQSKRRKPNPPQKEPRVVEDAVSDTDSSEGIPIRLDQLRRPSTTAKRSRPKKADFVLPRSPVAIKTHAERKCRFDGCNERFETRWELRQHAIMEHVLRDYDLPSGEQYPCTFDECAGHLDKDGNQVDAHYKSVHFLTRHIIGNHFKDVQLRFKCPIEDCTNMYDTFFRVDAWQAHLKTSHPKYKGRQVSYQHRDLVDNWGVWLGMDLSHFNKS